MKVFMITYGVILLLAGFALIISPLHLLIFGQMAKAEATQIVKTERGFPDIVLTNEDAVQNNLDANNYRAVFWNEFAFQTTDGQKIEIRCPIGSRLKPLCPLVDEDGLPTMQIIHYNPDHPNEAIFSSIVSTWFAPGVLIIVGLLGIIIGTVLYYWANKPISLPHFVSE